MTLESKSIPFSNAVPVFMKSFGKRNPDKVFYIIWRGNSQAGMFSNVFHVLNHLGYAREMGLTPVVDMENFPTVYNEPAAVRSTNNSWEYYFAQPSGFTLKEAYSSKRVVFCYGTNASAFGAYYDFPKFQGLAEQYLRIRPDILAEAEAFAQHNFRGDVLGVHVRGQEMKTAPGHPVPASVDEMLERAAAMLERYPIATIFVVSEEQSYIDAFRNRFGGTVAATPAFRTREVNAYTLPVSPRDRHMYLLGREVLVDALLLSRCGYLLAGGMGGLAFGSGVSMAAQLLNRNRYRHIELAYNGISPGGPGQQAFAEFVRDYFPDGRYRGFQAKPQV